MQRKILHTLYSLASTERVSPRSRVRARSPDNLTYPVFCCNVTYPLDLSTGC
jgi:hypothetical protein